MAPVIAKAESQQDGSAATLRNWAPVARRYGSAAVPAPPAKGPEAHPIPQAGGAVTPINVTAPEAMDKLTASVADMLTTPCRPRANRRIIGGIVRQLCSSCPSGGPDALIARAIGTRDREP